jgi:hypothetical protein
MAKNLFFVRNFTGKMVANGSGHPGTLPEANYKKNYFLSRNSLVS